MRNSSPTATASCSRCSTSSGYTGTSACWTTRPPLEAEVTSRPQAMPRSWSQSTSAQPGVGSITASTSPQCSRSSSRGRESSVTACDMMDTPSLIREADRAASAGDAEGAIALLEEAAKNGPADASLWLKLAAMHRMTGKPRVALDTVNRALQIQPLDFTALLLRASLLQRLDDPGAGEAWGHALAQKPDGDLPQQLAAVVAEGEAHHAAWLAAREARLTAAMAGAEARADTE